MPSGIQNYLNTGIDIDKTDMFIEIGHIGMTLSVLPVFINKV
jgi:hypothetical protein